MDQDVFTYIDPDTGNVVAAEAPLWMHAVVLTVSLVTISILVYLS